METLGISVDIVPRGGESLAEVGLDDAVSPQELERRALAGIGEPNPTVGHMPKKSGLRQSLDHAGYRGWLNVQSVGDGARGSWFPVS